jgi:hypothetical protein
MSCKFQSINKALGPRLVVGGRRRLFGIGQRVLNMEVIMHYRAFSSYRYSNGSGF